MPHRSACRHTAAFVATLLVGALVAACADAAHADAAKIANPATILCLKNGAKIEMEVGPGGGQRGICVFADGTRIDEWAYFRNKTRTQH